ncbi:MAG TPA: tetratricopeptide repeat protein [Methanobacterium sp.]|jgi:tetratricopeptide (TPR) repeat protein|nr:tetratricopeptide repeat protein [Methanobacterium sp.]HOI40072.1 tetratricopeptide repeat protein [Methanobacterium sp.]
MGIFDRYQSTDDTIKKYLKQLWEYQEAEADLMVEIATLLYEDDAIDDAVGFLERSVRIYEELGLYEQEASILDLMGDVYLNMDENNTALKYYRKCHQICTAKDLPIIEDVFNKIQELEEVEQTSTKIGTETSTSSVDEDSYSEIFDEGFSDEMEKVDYENIGSKLDDIISLLDEYAIYGSYQKFDNPLAHIKEAIEMSRSIGDDKGEAGLILIMGDISLKKEETEKSLDYFQQALKKFRKIGDDKGEAISRLMVGTAYFLLGETEEGSSYLRESMEIIKFLHDDKMEKAAMALLKSIYR